ncbi:hypothetical protein EDD37DRAFT_499701 [Exophiala viscosa]|uniref:uncharacterized protein n=1 Tax=Exophiala viscosa TaxID=2486360 RepID=UPI0021951065|nr:hypothetical protein EDD37DRAFT_499701 [Exophiala viscosa]
MQSTCYAIRLIGPTSMCHSSRRNLPSLEYCTICDLFKVSTAYSKAARPKRAAPATPVNPVGKAAAAFVAPAEDAADEAPDAALDALLAAADVAEEMTDPALEVAEPIVLVAELRAPAASLVMLPRIDFSAEVNEAREEAAPLLPARAAELRLERVAEKADSAELKLCAMELSAAAPDAAADSEAKELPDASAELASCAKAGTAARREKRRTLVSCMLAVFWKETEYQEGGFS